jgi:hypothetical protein
MLWWTYAKCINTNCYPVSPTPLNWTQSCMQSCTAAINVDWSIITQCVADSGGVDYNNDVENTLLLTELNERGALGIFNVPTMLVNLTPYRGSLVCPTPIDVSTCGVLGMICQVSESVLLLSYYCSKLAPGCIIILPNDDDRVIMIQLPQHVLAHLVVGQVNDAIPVVYVVAKMRFQHHQFFTLPLLTLKNDALHLLGFLCQY